MGHFTRRDLLKTSAALLAGAALAGLERTLFSSHAPATGKPNVLIFVFDAMSARHLSLYGYSRETTPQLAQFAEHASVYHGHYSTANFTTPGTASILTGLYPWTHRAFNFRGMIARSLVEQNLFHLIGSDYTRVAFTQNLWTDILLSQFEPDLDVHLPCHAFSLFLHALTQPDDLPGDRAMAYYAFQDLLNVRVEDPQTFPGSLLLGSVDLARSLARGESYASSEYPRGLPTNYDCSYENQSVLEGVRALIENRLAHAGPYLAYFHLWSPHSPYNARREFVGRFPEELRMSSKPPHPLATTSISEAEQQNKRREYDEFIAEVDAEFGRLISLLEKSGVLQNSYVIFTSDHGDLFERGEVGHGTALLYAPVIHVPLLISAPGQQTRADFHAPTSSLDLLPTILHLTGNEIPGWAQGRLLPGLGGAEDPDRAIFTMTAQDNAAYRLIERATFALMRAGHELLYYTGYPDHQDAFELYNLEADPGELQDLYPHDKTTAARMKDELLEAVDTANRKYSTKS